MTYEEILDVEPYSLPQAEKEKRLGEYLAALTEYHRANCEPYRRVLAATGYERAADAVGYEDIPFLPVRLFKELELCSVPREEVAKTMTSSGTSGQQVSKIFLDRKTAADQQKTLIKIVSSFTGGTRLPMVVIDSPSVIRNRASFTARGAGVLGFSIFAKKRFFALDEDMNLDLAGLREFIAAQGGRKILVFGFTFMVWKYLHKALAALGERVKLSNAVLLHGGGWKKLAEEAVSAADFRRGLFETCGLENIASYYGMAEQTGSIYMECEKGHLHASAYSDVIVRRAADFGVCDVGEAGIIQVLSALPHSYPGHSLLTEDAGVLLGIDDCPCGRKGKYFAVSGRIAKAELRGCSDTYAAER